MDEQKKIEQLIKDYFKCYFTDRDFEAVLKLFSPDITCIGTGFHEAGLTPKETINLFRKDIKQLPTPVNYRDVKIKVCSVSAYVSTAICTFEIHTEINESILHIPHLRTTFTFVKENKDWKILQFHISTPNDLQEEGEMYPLQKMAEQNLLLKKRIAEKTRELQLSNENLVKSNNTKDQLISIISHDLRGPFNSLLGFIDILEHQYDEMDTPDHKKFIKTIYSSSNSVYDLLDNLLSWSRIQRDSIEYSPTSINLYQISQKCTEVFLGLANNKNIRVINNIKESVLVFGDEFMINTILRNLISNAIKFTPDSGSITLSVEKNDSSTDKQISVYVQDTGVGLSSYDLKKIFNSENFESKRGTNNEEGTGIGLSICKEFIDYHKTKIWVESEVDVGSKFCFNLNLF